MYAQANLSTESRHSVQIEPRSTDLPLLSQNVLAAQLCDKTSLCLALFNSEVKVSYLMADVWKKGQDRI